MIFSVSLEKRRPIFFLSLQIKLLIFAGIFFEWTVFSDVRSCLSFSIDVRVTSSHCSSKRKDACLSISSQENKNGNLLLGCHSSKWTVRQPRRRKWWHTKKIHRKEVVKKCPDKSWQAVLKKFRVDFSEIEGRTRRPAVFVCVTKLVTLNCHFSSPKVVKRKIINHISGSQRQK